MAKTKGISKYYAAVLLIGTFLSSSLATASTFKRLIKQEELLAEYCPTSSLGPNYNCAIPRGAVYIITMNEKETALINKFVRETLDLGYAHDLSMKDFFHGHVILKGPQIVYENPDAMLADITAYLFHTEEYTDRWWEQRKQDVPIEKMIPRSLVGFPDGTLKPATDVVPREVMLHNYEGAGTVYAQDVVSARPELSDQPFYKTRGRADVQIKMPNGEVCTFISQFYFLPSPAGLNIFFRCAMY